MEENPILGTYYVAFMAPFSSCLIAEFSPKELFTDSKWKGKTKVKKYESTTNAIRKGLSTKLKSKRTLQHYR